MSIQNEQNNIIEDGINLSQRIQPVTIQENKEDKSSNTFSLQSEDIKIEQKDSHKSNKHMTDGGKERHDHQDEKNNEEQQMDYYEEHKKFLEKYKREREKQKKLAKNIQYKSVTESNQEQEIDEEERKEEKGRLKRLNTQMIGQKLKKIHSKLKNQMTVPSQQDEPKSRYKLFSQAVENKHDIERVSKEKRFVQSQQSKNYQYEEPSMLKNGKIPHQYRVKSQNFQDQIQLKKRAISFVRRIHKEQQDINGRKILRKKLEEAKRFTQEREKLRKIEQFNEVKRMERKLKAEENLLLMRQKSKINHIVNRGSLDELGKIIEEKQKKMQQIRASLRLKEQFRQKPFERRLVKQRQKTKTLLINDASFNQFQQNDTKLKKSKVFSNQKYDKRDTHRFQKERIPMRRYKFTVSAEESSGQEKNIKQTESSRRNHTQYVQMDDLTFGLHQIQKNREKQQENEFEQ